jgi:hypothetical protein
MRRIHVGNRFALLGLTVLFAVTTRLDAGPTVAFNANVNEWSSSTPPDPGNGIYPIGGSGETNGGFVVSTASNGDQIGLRAELRFLGPLPQTNDGVLTATYFAPAGTSGGNLALWDFEGDADLRATGHTAADYTATLTFTDAGGKVTPLDLVGSGLVPSNAVLYQSAENAGFSFLASEFPSFNPDATGVYSFDLKLVPKTFTGDTLEVKMNVDVVALPEPAGLTLFGLAVAGIGLRAWQKRRG